MDQKTEPPWWRNSLIYILILLAIIGLAFTFLPVTKKPTEVDLFSFIEKVKQGEVDTVQQSGNTIIGVKNDKEKIESGYIGSTEELINTLKDAGVTVGENGVKIEVKANKWDWGNLAISFIPLILFGGLLVFLIRSARKKA